MTVPAPVSLKIRFSKASVVLSNADGLKKLLS